MENQKSDKSFRPVDFTEIIKMYVCGPTVYSDSHLGHARTYMIVDLINRVMTNLLNKKTFLVMNITDIDDKIIKKAAESNTDWMVVAKTYEKSFFDSMSKLNIKLPDTIIHVSDVLDKITEYIQKIIDNGFAYVTSDGSVYFDTDAYVKEGYYFAGLVDDDESAYQSELPKTLLQQKRNKIDFALWKGRLVSEIGFNAEFSFGGQVIKSWGRPGWHIECSTMIHQTIGQDLDIHFGGIDLKFPHHHNERLQAHAYYHPKFKPDTNNSTQYVEWSNNFHHVGHLCIKGLKMSKSLKNFTTIDEALKYITTNQLRWLFILHKWTDQMDFDDNTMEQAKNFDVMITNFFNRIVNYPFDKKNVTYKETEFGLLGLFEKNKNKIVSELSVFNFDSITSLLAELIGKTNAYIDIGNANESLVRKIYDWLQNLTNILGFVYQTSTSTSVSDIMNVLIETRNSIRSLTREKGLDIGIKKKLFEILDTERNLKLPEIGIVLQDTKESSSWFQN